MKVQKLKNGKYRIRPMVNGVQKCFTFDFKPTIADIDKIIKENDTRHSASVSECVRLYIDTKESVLSPSTTKQYRSYLRNMPESFLALPICAVDSFKLQSLAND